MEGGGAAMNRLLGQGVTGVVCASDALALGAIRAARRRGVSVPGDVSVIGFDDSAYMSVVEAPLTTIRQPVRAMGAAAVKLLDAQINGQALARRGAAARARADRARLHRPLPPPVVVVFL
jgi:DNA-binding LacI/PurR family transcriptional regulator